MKTIKRFLAVLLTLLLAFGIVVYARPRTLADIDFEGLTYVEVLGEAIDLCDRILVQNFLIQRQGVRSSRDLVQLKNDHEAFRLRVIEHFMPNYIPGTVVDSDLFGENMVPIQSYDYRIIQGLLVADLPLENQVPQWPEIDAWLYAYEGMTTIEMAAFTALNERRERLGLEPVVHCPLLSVGARLRTESFSRFDLEISHYSGEFPTLAVCVTFNPVGSSVGLLAPGGGSAETSASVRLLQRMPAYQHGFNLANHHGVVHQQTLDSPNLSRVGIGKGRCGSIYIFTGTPAVVQR
jgi:hypothetical protein